MTAAPQIDRGLELVSTAVLEFLQSTGVTEFGPEPEGSGQIAVKADQLFSSSLGFSGPGIKGALVVTTYADALAATSPQQEFTDKFETADYADWIGEMANHIVGNLKRILGGFGVNFTLGTPVVVGGSGYKLLTADNGKFSPLSYQVATHKLKIHVAVELGPEINLAAEDDEAQDQAAGGDAFLF
jgi:CheY-specific phosphatase CheX